MPSRALLAVALLAMRAALALDNGVGLTPAMGWNSWNAFRCDINENLIRQVARALVDSGLRDAGYKYVNIDDCWMHKRGADGHIIPFKDKFPSGMRALGDYIHSLGLKFGIYSDTGNTTCEGYPGSYGHEAIDAADYASWGVDYLKYDYCGMERARHPPKHYYALMRDALNATGRPVLFSLCNWGTASPWEWGPAIGNSWRTGRDLFAVWTEHDARAVEGLPGYLQSFTTAVEDAARHAAAAGPGQFNDPDMLLVGLEGMTPYGIVERCPPHLPEGSCKVGDYISRERWGMVGGLTAVEQRTHFSFWCMLASPLILGNDPRRMSASTLRILTAPELLAVSQDPGARQARRVRQEGDEQVWRKDLTGGKFAVLLYNAGAAPRHVTLSFGRDLPDVAQRWARTVPRFPPCDDDPKVEACASWATSGECDRNPGFMKSSCPKSCDACPPALYEGKQATALVRDAWEREYKGVYTAQYTARNLQPHEGRVFVLTFEEPGMAERRALQALVDAEDAARYRRAPTPVPAIDDAAARKEEAARRWRDDEAARHEAAERAAESRLRAVASELEASDERRPPTSTAAECAAAHGGKLALLAAAAALGGAAVLRAAAPRPRDVKGERHAV